MAPLGLHLARPWQVVVAGPPNVGKSSLINALAGYPRAIVHWAPGTTRDAVTVETVLDGWPVELCDTAGLRTAGDAVERAGIELARRKMAQAEPGPLGLRSQSALVRAGRCLVCRVPWGADRIQQERFAAGWGTPSPPTPLPRGERGAIGIAAGGSARQRDPGGRHRRVIEGDRGPPGPAPAAARRGRARCPIPNKTKMR